MKILHALKLVPLAPRRIVIIPVENKTCHCGCQKTVIRYEASEQYHYQQAIHEIIEERREVVACPKGCDQSIETAKKPPHVLPKIKALRDFAWNFHKAHTPGANLSMP